MKLLVGVDGSAGSMAAVEQASALLAPNRDQLGLYCSPPSVRLRRTSDPQLIERARAALADAVFAESRSHVAEPLRESIHTILGEKPPAQGLLLAADVWRADMVAVGARGLGSLKRFLLGSVSMSVAQTARLPVLIARERTKPTSDAAWRLLLACDGSAESRHAAEVLSQFTWPPGTTGRVMTVIESLLVGEVPQWLKQQARDAETEAMAKAWVEEHEAEKLAKESELRNYCGGLPVPFQGSEPLVAEGHAAEKILKAIEGEEIDLVILGARGMGRVGRLLIGSTSTKVLAHAPCSVLIVPHAEQP